MSDQNNDKYGTPRTDAVADQCVGEGSPMSYIRAIDLCRRLERELESVKAAWQQEHESALSANGERACSYPTCGCAWTKDECPYAARAAALEKSRDRGNDSNDHEQPGDNGKEVVKGAHGAEHSTIQSSTAPRDGDPMTFICTKDGMVESEKYGTWVRLEDYRSAHSATTPSVYECRTCRAKILNPVDRTAKA